MLSALAAALGGSASGATAFGARCGTPVRVELVTRGTGRTAEEWTVLEAVLPAGYPLALHIRRHHWLGVTRVARGGVVDLPLGDAAFDRAFLIEAAPEDIARPLLDPGARDVLRTFRRVELDTVAIADFKVLRLAIRGWIEDVSAALVAIDFLVELGVRVADVYLAVDGVMPARMAGSPLPPPLDQRPARPVPAVRAVEVAALEAMRTRRARRYMVTAVVAFVVALVFGLFVLPRL